jgi:hypothetical protein
MEIEDYEFGKIKINGKQYKNDIIILPDKIIPNWWRKKGHHLQKQDLEEIWKAGQEGKINTLIIGTGAEGMMSIDEKVNEKAEQLGINIIAKKSKKACELYNKQRKQDKNIALAIHLTC